MFLGAVSGNTLEWAGASRDPGPDWADPLELLEPGEAGADGQEVARALMVDGPTALTALSKESPMNTSPLLSSAMP